MNTGVFGVTKLVTSGVEYLGKTALKKAAKNAVEKTAESFSQGAYNKSIGLNKNELGDSDLSTRLEKAESNGFSLQDFWDMVGQDKHNRDGTIKRHNSNKGIVRFVRTTVTNKDGETVNSVKLGKLGNKWGIGWCFRQNISIGHNKALRELFGEKLIEEWKPFFDDEKVSDQYGPKLQLSLEALKGIAYGWKYEEVAGEKDNVKIEKPNGPDHISGMRLKRTEVKKAQEYTKLLKSDETLKSIASDFLSMKFQNALKGGVNLNQINEILKNYGSYALNGILNPKEGGESGVVEPWTREDLLSYIVSGAGGKDVKLHDKMVVTNGTQTHEPNLRLMKERMNKVGEALNAIFDIVQFDQQADDYVDKVVKDSGNVANLQTIDLPTQIFRNLQSEIYRKELQDPEKSRRINRATDCFINNFFASKVVDGKTSRLGYFGKVLARCRTVEDKAQVGEEMKKFLHIGELKTLYKTFVDEYPTSDDESLKPAIEYLTARKEKLVAEEKFAKGTGDKESVTHSQGEIEDLNEQIAYLKILEESPGRNGISTDDVKNMMKCVCKELSDSDLMTDADLDKYNKDHPNNKLRTHTFESFLGILKESLPGAIRDELVESYIANRFMEKHVSVFSATDVVDDFREMASGVIKDKTNIFKEAVISNARDKQGRTLADILDGLVKFTTDRFAKMPGRLRKKHISLVKEAIEVFAKKCKDYFGRKDRFPTSGEVNKMATVLSLLTNVLKDEIQDITLSADEIFAKAKKGFGGLEDNLERYVQRGGIDDNTKAALLKIIQDRMAKTTAITDFLHNELDDLLEDFAYQAGNQSNFVKTVQDRLDDCREVNVKSNLLYAHQLFYAGVLGQSYGEFSMSAKEFESELNLLMNPKESLETNSDQKTEDSQPTKANNIAPQGNQKGKADKKPDDGSWPMKDLFTFYDSDRADMLTDTYASFLGSDDQIVKGYVSEMRNSGLTFHPLSNTQQLAVQKAHLNSLWAKRVIQHCPGQLPWFFDKIRSGFKSFAAWISGWGKTPEVKEAILQRKRFTNITQEWLDDLIEGLESDMAVNAENYKDFEERFVKSCRACVRGVLDEALKGVVQAQNGNLPKNGLAALKDYPADALNIVVDNILSGLTDRIAPFMMKYANTPEAYSGLLKDSAKMNALAAKLLGIPPRYVEGKDGIAEAAKTVVKNPHHPIMQAITAALQTKAENVRIWLKPAKLEPGKDPGPNEPCYQNTEKKILEILTNKTKDASKERDDEKVLFSTLLERWVERIDKAPMTIRSGQDLNHFAQEVADRVWDEAQRVFRDGTLAKCVSDLRRQLAEWENKNLGLNSSIHQNARAHVARFTVRAFGALVDAAERGALTDGTISVIMTQFESDVRNAHLLASGVDADLVRKCRAKSEKFVSDLRQQFKQAKFSECTLNQSVDEFVRNRFENELGKMCEPAVKIGRRIESDQLDALLGKADLEVKGVVGRLQELGEWNDVKTWSEDVLNGIRGENGDKALGESLTAEIVDRAFESAQKDPDYLASEYNLAKAAMTSEVAQDRLNELKEKVKIAFKSAFEKACRDSVYTGLVNDAWEDVRSSPMISQIENKDVLKVGNMKLTELTVFFVKNENLGMDEFKSQLADAMLGVKTDIWMLAHEKEVDNRIDSIRRKFNETAGFSGEDNRNSALEKYWKSFGDTYRANLEKDVKDKLKNNKGELSKVDLTLDAFERDNEDINGRIEMHGTKTFIDGMKIDMAANSAEVAATQKELKDEEAESNSTALFKFLSNRTTNADLQEKSPFFRLLSVLITGNSNLRAKALNDLALLIKNVNDSRIDPELMKKAKEVVKQFFSAYSEILSGAFSSNLTCEQVLAERTDLGTERKKIDDLETWIKEKKNEVTKYKSGGNEDAADSLKKSLEGFEGTKTELKKQLLELNNAVNQVFTALMKLKQGGEQ